MKTEELLRGAQEAITVRRVYGEAIERDGVTLVPAAMVVGGGGGGGDEAGNGGGGFGLMARPIGAWAIRDGDWKLILPASQNEPNGKPELYRITRDLHEETNLAAREPDTVRRLTRQLDEWWPGASAR